VKSHESWLFARVSFGEKIMEVHFTIPVDPNALAYAGTVAAYVASGIASVAGWYRRSGKPVETNGQRIIAAIRALGWPVIAAALAVAPVLIGMGWTIDKVANIGRAAIGAGEDDTPL